MKREKRPLTSLRVQNFKAVEDTGVLKPGGLTVFIGDNGVGKSSVIEALRFLATLSQGSLDDALGPFRGYEHVRWKGDMKPGKKPGRATTRTELQESNPIEIAIQGHVGLVKASAKTKISGQNQNLVVFEDEMLTVGTDEHVRDEKNDRTLRPERSILARTSWFDDWQFLDMVPENMKWPVRRTTRSGTSVRLASDGSNLAEYLVEMRDVPEAGADAFEGLMDALQVILPYARDLEPLTSELFERQVALRLFEGSFTVPGWMLSTGTLRLVALLALLKHPKPPSLLCIEEVENGLDPRTIQLVVSQILRAVESGRTQIMLTTHSPYLLDLVPLDSLVIVEREAGKPPRFDRSASHHEVVEWAQRFAPGRLYTMGALGNRGGQR